MRWKWSINLKEQDEESEAYKIHKSSLEDCEKNTLLLVNNEMLDKKNVSHYIIYIPPPHHTCEIFSVQLLSTRRLRKVLNFTCDFSSSQDPKQLISFRIPPC